MKSFEGIFTALITPFFDGEVDFESLERLVKFQVDGGVKGFVVNGTTAESPNLSEEEVKEIFLRVRKLVGDSFPLIVGTGSNSTSKTIQFTKKAEEWGADAALVVVPYYNKPTQEGLCLHFEAVAKETQLPIILYNVPGRTITELKPETLIKLQELKNIIGIKEASGNLEYIKWALPKVKENFLFTSGDDATSMEFISCGGRGVISVASHVYPRDFVSLSERAINHFDEVKKEYKKYDRLNELLFVEPNPTPVKQALQEMGVIRSAECRLPLTKMSQDNAKLLKAELGTLGIL
ncbi:MAG: 4-hydroxy-tetrahydrodipicolinate synthase [Bdellovibrionales bacterium]|nr:4-hydroxy-tetrahydrodipicolinate synthase [Bdellovibrionales bacterium]